MSKIEKLQNFKEQIADFVMKLYEILEKNQFNDYVCWANDGKEVQIKNKKKFEENVLGFYFRHQNLDSFARQMNMYGFKKSKKISKERNHIFFENPHFLKHDVEQLALIKRHKTNKQRKGSENSPQLTLMETSNKISLDQNYIKQEKIFEMFENINTEIMLLIKKYPEVTEELSKASKICMEMERKKNGISREVSFSNLYDQESNELRRINENLQQINSQEENKIFSSQMKIGSVESIYKLIN